VDWKDRRLIKNKKTGMCVLTTLYDKFKHQTMFFTVTVVISVEELKRITMENCRDGITVGGKLIQAIRFADDQAILTDDVRTMDRLTATADGLRIKINTKKTKSKYMTISKGEATNLIMKANGFLLDQAKEFSYFGSDRR